MSQAIDISITESAPTTPDFTGPARAVVAAVLPLVLERGGADPGIGDDDHDSFYAATTDALRPVVGNATVAGARMLHQQVFAYAEDLLSEGPDQNAAFAALNALTDFIANATSTGTDDVLARVAHLDEELRVSGVHNVAKALFLALKRDIEALISSTFKVARNDFCPIQNSLFGEWRLKRKPGAIEGGG